MVRGRGKFEDDEKHCRLPHSPQRLRLGTVGNLPYLKVVSKKCQFKKRDS